MIRKVLFFCCFLFTLSFSAPARSQRLNDYESLKKEFQHPGVSYRPAPLWVWNNELSKEYIDSNMLAFKNAGIGGVYIHPRTGLQIAYLSKEWFKWVDYALKVASDLDMKVWIYDEYVCPSGFAGGNVPNEMPASYNQGVGLIAERLTSLDGSADPATAKYCFKKISGAWTNITGEQDREKGKTGEYMLFHLKSENQGKGGYAGFSYVDLMAPGVTRKFMDVTMKGYEKIASRYFGTLIPGIMTDEPQIAPSAGGIRYTPDLFSTFKARWGYDLEDHLPSLVSDTGDWKRVRHNFRTVLLQLFIDRWSKPWYEYTQQHNMIWTGHYWENTWPDLWHGPDNMAMYAWHQMPGVDMLFNSTERRPDQFGNNIAIKQLGAVRNQFDRHRAFSETYGGSGWDLRFEDMKRMGEWQYALGVNYLNMHLSHMSLVGVRKCDYPQSFMPYAPYWSHFKDQMDYFARLSVAMSSGRQVNRILVIEPTTSVWMYYPNTTEIHRLGDRFRSLVDALEQYQIEYDLGCEDIIADHGRIQGRQFMVNKAAYDLVVLDRSVENLDAATVALLQQYLRNGGKVLQFGDALKNIDGRPDPSLDGLCRSAGWCRRQELNQGVISDFLMNPDFNMTPSVSGRLHHQRRTFADGELFFFSNFNLKEEAGTYVRARGASVEELLEENGRTGAVSYRREGPSVAFAVTLPPGGSALYFVHKDRTVPAAQPREELLEKVEAGSPSRVGRMQPNVMVLDYLSLDFLGEHRQDIYYYKANTEVYRHFGFKHDPWNDVQFKTEFMDRNRDFKRGEGFEVEYRFDMAEGVDRTALQLVVERGQLYRVTVNGSPVKADGGHWLDPDFRTYDISGAVRPGKNFIRLSVDRFNVLCEIMPVYLRGNFSLKPESRGWSMIPFEPLSIGDWVEQGQPFYPGQVSYRRSLKVEEDAEYDIVLPRWYGTVAEIKVNGQKAGIIRSQPYRLRVSLKKGVQQIEVVVCGSLKNAFGPHHVKTDGYLRPTSFLSGKEHPVPGLTYELPRYGLLQDFEIFKCTNK